ncbi:TerB family tellurite resistance protein [bacterium]|nr:TerB family tellurite resistance protein [bacterium]
MDNRTLFQTLAIAALVDGEISAEESALLEKHAATLKLLPSEAKEILDDVKSGKSAGIAKPHHPEARLSLFRAVVQIVRADKKLTGKEHELLRRLGNALEIPVETVDQALKGKKV